MTSTASAIITTLSLAGGTGSQSHHHAAFEGLPLTIERVAQQPPASATVLVYVSMIHAGSRQRRSTACGSSGMSRTRPRCPRRPPRPDPRQPAAGARCRRRDHEAAAAFRHRRPLPDDVGQREAARQAAARSRCGRADPGARDHRAGHGSDLAAIKTHAQRDGDMSVVNGAKTVSPTGSTRTSS